MTADPFNLRKESSVSSRFVSSTELSEAQKRREADLKAAYARIGQEAPASASLKEEEYDPRSLYERLQANKDAKQENFEETWKLSNQFRGIDEGESEFLAEVAKDKAEAERRKREQERKELEEFRRATRACEISPNQNIAPKASASPPPPVAAPAPSSISAKGCTKRKRPGNTLGVKKKSRAAPSSSPSSGATVATGFSSLAVPIVPAVNDSDSGNNQK